mmetsp:Transcript_16835/g.46196  ORF Transcript_16835/g.46196 Transcript_16835/m.46196 type:complete len:241 (+) Transcript_16835:512-1234(+)
MELRSPSLLDARPNLGHVALARSLSSGSRGVGGSHRRCRRNETGRRRRRRRRRCRCRSRGWSFPACGLVVSSSEHRGRHDRRGFFLHECSAIEACGVDGGSRLLHWQWQWHRHCHWHLRSLWSWFSAALSRFPTHGGSEPETSLDGRHAAVARCGRVSFLVFVVVRNRCPGSGDGVGIGITSIGIATHDVALPVGRWRCRGAAAAACRVGVLGYLVLVQPEILESSQVCMPAESRRASNG